VPRQKSNSSSLPTTPANSAHRGAEANRSLAGSARRNQGPPWSHARRGPGTLQEFCIPIHGLVRLHEDALPIVNHPAFQHLRYVYQLGQTFLVYPGATHSRLEHALGTRAVVDLIIQALKLNSESESRARIPKPGQLVGHWTRFRHFGPRGPDSGDRFSL
jgi:hypothetical protein